MWSHTALGWGNVEHAHLGPPHEPPGWLGRDGDMGLHVPCPVPSGDVELHVPCPVLNRVTGLCPVHLTTPILQCLSHQSCAQLPVLPVPPSASVLSAQAPSPLRGPAFSSPAPSPPGAPAPSPGSVLSQQRVLGPWWLLCGLIPRQLGGMEGPGCFCSQTHLFTTHSPVKPSSFPVEPPGRGTGLLCHRLRPSEASLRTF